jgi:hypothetical protein
MGISVCQAALAAIKLPVAGLGPAIHVLLPRHKRSSTLMAMGGWVYIMTNRRNGTL